MKNSKEDVDPREDSIKAINEGKDFIFVFVGKDENDIHIRTGCSFKSFAYMVQVINAHFTCVLADMKQELNKAEQESEGKVKN